MFGYSFIKNDIIFMYLLCIYKNPIILSLFKINLLNFTMNFITILTWPLKTYAIRLHNLISVNIFCTIKDHGFFFIIVKRKLKTNKLKNLLKTQTSLNPVSMNILFAIKDDNFPLSLLRDT